MNKPKTTIKDRTKKFYNNHQEKIEWFCFGAAATSAYILYNLPKHDKIVREGMRLDRADEHHDPDTDTTYLYVSHKNGSSGRYVWDKKEYPKK